MTITLWPELEDLNWLTGSDFPEADEDALWRCAQAWRDAAAALGAIRPVADGAAQAVRPALGAAPGAAFDIVWRQLAQADDGLADRLAKACAELAQACSGFAEEIEYAKLEYIAALVVLGGTLVALAVSLWMGGISAAGVPLAISAAQFAVRAILIRLLTAAAVGAAFNAAIDAVAQAVQLVEGHRDSWDWSKTANAAENGAIFGVVGGSVFLGAGRLAPGFLRTRLGAVTAAGVTGAVSAVVVPLAHGQRPTVEEFVSGAVLGTLGGAHQELRPGRGEPTLSTPDPVRPLLDQAALGEAVTVPGEDLRPPSVGHGNDPTPPGATRPTLDQAMADAKAALPSKVLLDLAADGAVAEGAAHPLMSILDGREIREVAAEYRPDPGPESVARPVDAPLLSSPGPAELRATQPSPAQPRPAEASTVAAPTTEPRLEPTVRDVRGTGRASDHGVGHEAGPEAGYEAGHGGGGADPRDHAVAAAHPADPADPGGSAMTTRVAGIDVSDAEAVAMVHSSVFTTPAGLAFYPAGDAVIPFAQTVQATPHYLTLDLHGSPDGFWIDNRRLTPAQFATALRELIADGTLVVPPGGGIKLLSCDTAFGGVTSAAAQLARELGVEVIAPDRPVWTGLAGEEIVATAVPFGGAFVPAYPPDGSWHRFDPHGAEAELDIDPSYHPPDPPPARGADGFGAPAPRGPDLDRW